MQAVHLECRFRGNRPGIVLLMMLLLVIVLGVLVYFFGIRPEDRKTRRMQEKSPDKYPWVEEFRLHKPGEETQQLPSAKQPDITETIILKGKVNQERDERGKIAMIITPDGTVDGSWGADYSTASPRIDCTVMSAKFKGNTDPSKIYSDEYGEDLSKLYIITKGKYLILETNFDTGKVRKLSGYIYVTGWIDPGYFAFGRLHLTADKRSQIIYEWIGELAQVTPFLK